MNAKPQPQKMTRTSALQLGKGSQEFNMLKQQESMRMRQTNDGKLRFQALNALSSQHLDPKDDYESH